MLSDIDKQILQDIIKNPSTGIANALSIATHFVEKWFYDCCEIFHQVYLENGQAVVAFVVDSQLTSLVKFSSDFVKNMINSDRETAVIDLHLAVNYVTELSSADRLVVSNYGEQNKKVILRLDGEILEVWINGFLRHMVNVMHPISQKEKRVNKYARSYKDYKLLVDDHSAMRLINLMDEYWHDRGKRILRKGDTEKYFQKSLFDWLDSCLSDARPKIETRTNAGDRTDIDIYAHFEGAHYVIEIKWLGKNGSGTEYKQDKIIAGIGQIITYLERDSNLNEVYLVFYDGRPEEEHIKASDFDKALIPPKGECKIIFLESETASTKGKKYANRSQLGS